MPSRDFRRDSANVTATRIAWPFSCFPLSFSLSLSFFFNFSFFVREKAPASRTLACCERVYQAINQSRCGTRLFLSQNRFFILNRIVDMWCTERLTLVRELFLIHRKKKSVYTSICELRDLKLLSVACRYSARYNSRFSHFYRVIPVLFWNIL